MSLKTNNQPWMTADIEQKINKSRALFKKGKSIEYKKQADEVERETFLRKRLYLKRKLKSSNPSYWKLVNNYREANQIADDPAIQTTGSPPKSPLHPLNVRQSLCELNISATGPDGMSVHLLKSARLELCDTISVMFNALIVTGHVPTQPIL